MTYFSRIKTTVQKIPASPLSLVALAIALCGIASVPIHSFAAASDPASAPGTQVPAQSPFNDMEKSMMQIQNEMNHMFNNSFNQSPDDLWRSNAVFSPAVNISDKDGKYTVTVDVPGIDSKDLLATVNGNTLTISSQTNRELDEKNKNYIRHERAMSSFERVIQLPDTADVDKAEASYKNGQIVVTMPKTADVKKLSRRLEIKPAG